MYGSAMMGSAQQHNRAEGPKKNVEGGRSREGNRDIDGMSQKQATTKVVAHVHPLLPLLTPPTPTLHHSHNNAKVPQHMATRVGNTVVE